MGGLNATERMSEWIKIGGAILIGLFVIGLVFGDTSACEVKEVTVADDVFIINGEFDYGFIVNVLTSRTGQNGEVTIAVRLSSTEGDVRKQRTIFITEDQSRWTAIQFPEPTVNALQVRATATCKTI